MIYFYYADVYYEDGNLVRSHFGTIQMHRQVQTLQDGSELLSDIEKHIISKMNVSHPERYQVFIKTLNQL